MLLVEDELAHDIDQADLFTGKLQLAIIDIDQALKGDLNSVDRHALENESSIITTPRTDLSPLTTTVPSLTESTDSPKLKFPNLTLK